MRVHVLSFVSMSMLATAAHAGTILEMVNRDLSAGGRESVSTIYAQDGRIRSESQPGDSVMIFKDDTIHNVNNKDRSYTVLDRESMRKLSEQLNPLLKQMQEQLKNMPPEQRAQVERMMSARMPGLDTSGTQEIRKTARKDKVAGHACSYVEILRNGERAEEMCVVPTGSLKGSKDLVDAMARMSALAQELIEGLDAPWLKDMIARQISNYEEIGGFPILTRQYSSQKPVSESMLKSIRADTVPADAFTIPAGYARKDMMQPR